MLYQWDRHNEVIAAGTSCPMADCGALMLAYRLADDGHDNAEPWEFTCPRCGFEFTVSESDLIFHSVPQSWLFAKIHIA